MIKLTESLEVAWNVVSITVAKSIGSPELTGFVVPFENGREEGFTIHGASNHPRIPDGIALRKVAVCKHRHEDVIRLWYMEGARFDINECKDITFPEGAYGDASQWIINYLGTGEDSAGVLVEA